MKAIRDLYLTSDLKKVVTEVEGSGVLAVKAGKDIEEFMKGYGPDIVAQARKLNQPETKAVTATPEDKAIEGPAETKAVEGLSRGRGSR